MYEKPKTRKSNILKKHKNKYMRIITMKYMKKHKRIYEENIKANI